MYISRSVDFHLRFLWMTLDVQTVFENSLMQHHVALPPDAMGKVTYVAPAGQYSLKVCLFNYSSLSMPQLIFSLSSRLWLWYAIWGMYLLSAEGCFSSWYLFISLCYGSFISPKDKVSPSFMTTYFDTAMLVIVVLILETMMVRSWFLLINAKHYFLVYYTCMFCC